MLSATSIPSAIQPATVAKKSADARNSDGCSTYRVMTPSSIPSARTITPLRSGRQSSDSSTTRHRQNQTRQVWGRIS